MSKYQKGPIEGVSRQWLCWLLGLHRERFYMEQMYSSWTVCTRCGHMHEDNIVGRWSEPELNYMTLPELFEVAVSRGWPERQQLREAVCASLWDATDKGAPGARG